MISNIIPKVEKMWDLQERNGHCEVRNGQEHNPWKEEEVEEEVEDKDDDDNDDDDPISTSQ